jgi:predicted TIM-barrel fold metal-dependent hydrolase
VTADVGLHRRAYRLVDTDTHVNEPPDLWTARVSTRFRDRAPRIERFEAGDAWVIEGVDDPINFGLNACAGMAPEHRQPWIRWEDIRRGGFDPKVRVDEMDEDGVDAQLLYPTPRLMQGVFATPEPEFHIELIRAYNDWLAEYAEHDPTRFGGLALLPNCGVDHALAEIDRVVGRPGIVGVLIGCYPHGDLELRDEDDAVWERVAGAGMALHIHVSLTDDMPRAHTTKIVGDVRFYDAPKRILQFVWSGVLDRIPDLRIVMAEVDAGWLPYFKEQVDDRYRRMGPSADMDLSGMPSDYIERAFYFTYITDHHGVRSRHAIGVDRMMWSSDYPHVGADWPHSWRTIAADMSGIPAEERHLLLAGNALRLYRFGDGAT